MRISASILILAGLLLAHTSVMAQDKIDEFEAFRAKLNASKGVSPGMRLPPDGVRLVQAGGFPRSATPATPEELQALMEEERAEEERKLLQAIRTGAFTPPAEREDPFKDMMPVESKVTDVTVYSDRAKVTRTAEVNIVKGAQTLVFKDLPFGLMPESLRSEGSSHDAEVVIGAIQKKDVDVPVETKAEDKTTFEEIDHLEAEKSKLEAEARAYELQGDFFKTLSSRAMESSTSSNADDGKKKEAIALNVTPETWLKASRAYRDGLAEIMLSEATLQSRLDEINLQIQRKNNALRQAYVGKNRMRVVVVPVSADAAGKLSLKITYQVGNVSWQPVYDARLSSGNSDVEIVQYATVRQGTQEEWKDVNLTLSTATPPRHMKLKEMNPFWIDAIEQPPSMPVPIGRPQDDRLSYADPLQEWRSKAEARRLSLENEAAPPEETDQAPEVVPMVQPIMPQPRFGEARPVMIAAANIENGGLASQYKIPGATTVTKDGSETKVLIGNFDAESRLQVHIRPQQSMEAQSVIHIKLKGENPVLPGRANLFRDGAYAGQINLPLMMPDAEHDISLGADEQVTVKRRTLRDEKQEQGLISKDSLIAREYVTEIQSLHDGPVEVIVQETTPAPKSEKITVNLRPDFTTQGYKKDEDNVKGLLGWHFTLQPKERNPSIWAGRSTGRRNTVCWVFETAKCNRNKKRSGC